MLPGAVTQLARATCAASEDPCEPLHDVLNRARAAAIEDLVLYKPRYVLIDARKVMPYFDGVAFDFADLLKGDPRFEQLGGNYRYTGSLLIFGIWVREWDVAPVASFGEARLRARLGAASAATHHACARGSGSRRLPVPADRHPTQ